MITLSGPPCYAVIFSSQCSTAQEGYEETAQKMAELASRQPGFLGMESARNTDGFGITVSYWRSLDDVAAWKSEISHRSAQEQGRSVWYEDYHIHVARVERSYGKQ